MAAVETGRRMKSLKVTSGFLGLAPVSLSKTSRNIFAVYPRHEHRQIRPNTAAGNIIQRLLFHENSGRTYRHVN